MNRTEQLWQADAPRALSDADVARLLAVTQPYVTRMRVENGWLPPRRKTKPGASGGLPRGARGVPRFRFLDAVACEVARIYSTAFGWKPRELRRMAEIIRSGDKEAVEASLVITWKGKTPGTVMVLFHAHDKVGLFTPSGRALAAGRDADMVLQEVSLLKVVVTVANALFKKAARIEFSDVVGGAKKRRKRKRK